MSQNKENINKLVVNIFNNIMQEEESALIVGEFKNISVNDMHIIEAIGMDEPKNMSKIASILNITVGTLTIAINNLLKKDMWSEGEVRRIEGLSLFLYPSLENRHMSIIRGIIRRS